MGFAAASPSRAQMIAVASGRVHQRALSRSAALPRSGPEARWQEACGALIVPGSQQLPKQPRVGRKGLHEISWPRGFEWRKAAASMCSA